MINKCAKFYDASCKDVQVIHSLTKKNHMTDTLKKIFHFEQTFVSPISSP